MWTERLRPFKDGIVLPTVIALSVATILSVWSTDNAKQQPFVLQCQEVVVQPERRGNVLATCPAGTRITLEDGFVFCRCGIQPPRAHVTVPPLYDDDIDPETAPSPPIVPPGPVPPVQTDDKPVQL